MDVEAGSKKVVTTAGIVEKTVLCGTIRVEVVAGMVLVTVVAPNVVRAGCARSVLCGFNTKIVVVVAG
jgi:hypothetical protein